MNPNHPDDSTVGVHVGGIVLVAGVILGFMYWGGFRSVVSVGFGRGGG